MLSVVSLLLICIAILPLKAFSFSLLPRLWLLGLILGASLLFMWSASGFQEAMLCGATLLLFLVASI